MMLVLATYLFLINVVLHLEGMVFCGVIFIIINFATEMIFVLFGHAIRECVFVPLGVRVKPVKQELVLIVFELD